MKYRNPILCGYSTTTRTATNRHELINFRDRGISLHFMSIRDVLRFCYNTDTTELRLFGWIRLGLYEYGKIQLRYRKLYWEIRHESVKNTTKRLRIIYESGTNKGTFVAVLDNS